MAEPILAKPGDKSRIEAAWEDFLRRSGIDPTQETAEAFILAALALVRATPGNTYDAVQAVAKDLPEAWTVQLELERGSGLVRLYDPKGEDTVIEIDDSSIDEQLLEALRIAEERDPIEFPPPPQGDTHG